MTIEDGKALEQLIINNPELERLETLLDEFNIFEVIGAVRNELRHSDFLAFLLNPSQKHGLHDGFVKGFLQKALIGADQRTLPVSAIEIDIWELEGLEVRREWHNIDILLLSEKHRLAIIIENKIDSGEHSNQLQRYFKTVAQQFPDWHKLGIYLTPEGEEASEGDYLSLSYEDICELIESLGKARASLLGQDVLTLMQHYTTMLRRHIVSGSELEKLAQGIYAKHRQALDFIYEHRPDMQSELQDILENIIAKTDGVMLDYSSKSYVVFAVQNWDLPGLLQGEGWTASGRILLFQFENYPESLRLKLFIGPGNLEIRQRLFEVVLGENAPLKAYRKNLGQQWNTIYLLEFLNSKDYIDTSSEELSEKIDTTWKYFLDKDLSRIEKIIQEQEWLKEE